LHVSGARADLAHRQSSALGVSGDIEIELAIPANMGLGSDRMLQACMARLAMTGRARRDAGAAPARSLADHAFDRGGLLLVSDDARLLERAEIAHSDEKEDWAFVLVLPREPDGLPEHYESQRLAALIAAAADGPDGQAEAALLFAAARDDDFTGFARGLAAVHSTSEAMLSSAGADQPLTDRDREILGIMRAHGAAMCARALTGLGLYGLIQGGEPSRALRKVLVGRLGYFGPLVMASICDNRGARVSAL
jgi:predicted sugar kinase